LKPKLETIESWKRWLASEDFRQQDMVDLTDWLVNCEDMIRDLKEIRQEIKQRIKEVT